MFTVTDVREERPVAGERSVAPALVNLWIQLTSDGVLPEVIEGAIGSLPGLLASLETSQQWHDVKVCSAKSAREEFGGTRVERRRLIAVLQAPSPSCKAVFTFHWLGNQKSKQWFHFGRSQLQKMSKIHLATERLQKQTSTAMMQSDL